MKARYRKKAKHVKYRANTKRLSILLLTLAAVIAGLLVYASIEKRPHGGSTPRHTDDQTVEVFNGESYVEVPLQKGVEVNSLTAGSFSKEEGKFPSYSGTEYDTLCGIDVSEHQGQIDWQAAYEGGVRFAIIRIGGRYYGSGELYSDDCFAYNLSEAKASGIKVGAYFFSQAISPEEAVEEAKFCLDAIGDTELELPVFFDWERITEDAARTDGLDGETLTDCARAFCRTVEKSGLKGGVYLYSETGYYMYELNKLNDYMLWAAAPGAYPYFYYKTDIWQCSFKGDVNGIDGNCDLNMLFIEKENRSLG